jgi:hypothetical protein
MYKFLDQSFGVLSADYERVRYTPNTWFKNLLHKKKEPKNIDIWTHNIILYCI